MVDAWLMGRNELALFNWSKAFYKVGLFKSLKLLYRATTVNVNSAFAMNFKCFNLLRKLK